LDNLNYHEHKHLSHYKCLACEDHVLEKVELDVFCKSDEENDYVQQLCQKYGLNADGEFALCKDCNLVYPYVYHTQDLVKGDERFGCPTCGYYLEILGIVDEESLADKIYYCPDCERHGYSESYLGFRDAPDSDNKYFLPLSHEEVKHRFKFLEVDEGSPVDMVYYSEAFSHDPDYVINRLSNMDCGVFVQVLKYAYEYTPEEQVLPEEELEKVETQIDDEIEDSDAAFLSSIPPCPNHNVYEEFVVEQGCLYLKTKVDRAKNYKNITASAFILVVSLVFWFSVRGESMPGKEVISDLIAMVSFVSLALLVMSLSVNYFNLFYYMELTCENGNLVVNINDKIQSDHWQFASVKSVALAQYSKKKKSTYTVELDAPISTSKKSHSGIKTIGLYIYQHKKRYLIRLPFSHLQIKWLGIVIREVCKSQGIIKMDMSNTPTKKTFSNPSGIVPKEASGSTDESILKRLAEEEAIAAFAGFVEEPPEGEADVSEQDS